MSGRAYFLSPLPSPDKKKVPPPSLYLCCAVVGRAYWGDVSRASWKQCEKVGWGSKEEEKGLLGDCQEGHEGGVVVRAKLELGEATKG